MPVKNTPPVAVIETAPPPPFALPAVTSLPVTTTCCATMESAPPAWPVCLPAGIDGAGNVDGAVRCPQRQPLARSRHVAPNAAYR